MESKTVVKPVISKLGAGTFVVLSLLNHPVSSLSTRFNTEPGVGISVSTLTVISGDGSERFPAGSRI